MSEIFKEYLIKQKKSPKDVMIQTGLIVGAILLSLILFVVGGQFIGPLLVVGIIFGTGFLFNKFSRDYMDIRNNNYINGHDYIIYKNKQISEERSLYR